MAGPGKVPKPRSQLSRRNAPGAGAAKLHAVDPSKVKIPALPQWRTVSEVDSEGKRTFEQAPWRQETLDWWSDLWASPMSAEYHSSDLHGLLVLAALMDDFWREPSTKLAAEIRLQRQCFGLTPIDRRRLQWEIERGEDAEERTKARRAPKAAGSTDPRRANAG